MGAPAYFFPSFGVHFFPQRACAAFTAIRDRLRGLRFAAPAGPPFWPPSLRSGAKAPEKRFWRAGQNVRQDEPEGWVFPFGPLASIFHRIVDSCYSYGARARDSPQ